MSAPETASELEGGVNFGPGPDAERSVEDLLTLFARAWGPGGRWEADGADHPHEARLLRLDTAKARETLGFAPILDFEQAAQWTAQWYRAYADSEDVVALTMKQLDRYLGQRVRLSSPFPPDAIKDVRNDRLSVAG